MDYKKVGQFLSKLRKDKNLTQSNLADILNVTHQAVSRWETGESIPDVQTLINLSEFYNITIDEILNGEIKDKDAIITQTVIENNDSINSFETTLNKVKKQHIVAYSISLIGLVLFYGITWSTYYEILGLSVQYILLIIGIVFFYFGYHDLKEITKKTMEKHNFQYEKGFKQLKSASMIMITVILMSISLTMPYILYDNGEFVKSIISFDYYRELIFGFIRLGIYASLISIICIEKYYYKKWGLNQPLLKKILPNIYMLIILITLVEFFKTENLVSFILVIILLILDDLYKIIIKKQMDYLLLRIMRIIISILFIYLCFEAPDNDFNVIGIFEFLLYCGVIISLLYYFIYFLQFKKYTYIERRNKIYQIVSLSSYFIFLYLLVWFSTAYVCINKGWAYDHCSLRVTNLELSFFIALMYIIIDYICRILIRRLSATKYKLHCTSNEE